MAKLRRLRGVLKSWNKEVFGNVDVAIRELGDNLATVQKNIANSGYNDELFNEEINAQAKLNIILARKDDFLKQKSRITWLHDGDRNSSFFHNMIKFRKHRLNIGHLMIDGIVSTDSGSIERHIIDYFSNLFTETKNRWVETVELEAIIDHSIFDAQNDSLICLPDEIEISAAVHGMDSSSAPGPDGFTGAFFRSSWQIVKGDIVTAVRTFFWKSYLPNGCNASTLILIPKIEEVVTVADLRPIILSNLFFKIISKILASRLSKVAAGCVLNNQFGFIAGRSIHDCILLGSEGFNFMKRVNNGSNMACKIDIRKAFDTMSWSFILQALRVFGFHEKFVNWISVIFHTARISILYNGQLRGYFSCSRGVRQGDPLSPILFGIVEDVLSHLIMNCVSSGHLVPMGFSRAANFPTHLLYADDILIFYKASVRNARKIKEILHYYGGISGQICSNEKSSLFLGDGVARRMGGLIQRELQFARGSLPVTYLGAPLFVGRPKASHFMSIKDKIVNKFDNWQGRQLSMAGRLCLVKSVIQSSIIHSMMVFRWPKSLLLDLDKKCRNFIWTGRVDKNGTCTMNWSRCCALKEEGGLGIRAFATMNKSFLMKMAWKVIKGQDWAHKIMRTRYLDGFGNAKPNIATSSVWLGLRQEVPSLVRDSYSYLGSGDSTYFWTDNWLGYKLVDRLGVPHYMHDLLKFSVADYFYNGIWHFAASFVERYPDIVHDICTLPIGREGDMRYWKHSLKGEVSASLAFREHCHNFPKVSWGRWLWEKYIPVRRSITCWRVIHRRLPSLDNLIRRGLITPNFCSICRQDAESIDHIFWVCGRVKEVWSSFLAWFGVEYLSECVDLHSFLVEAWNLNFSPQITSFWKAGIVTLVWKIWHDLNKIVFDNAGFHGPGVLKFIKVYFKEMEANFTRLGHVSSAWQDYVITRAIGVQSRIAPPPEMVNVYWWPPFGDWMKVNTDGSALGAPSLISAGGVFRDSWGQIRGCFHEKGGQGFAFEAELLAVITAISIAHEQGWLKLWIEVDSSYVVNLLDRKSEDVPWRFVAHWKRTLQLLSTFQLQVTHIFREGNVVADIMENHNREEGWWPFGIEEIKNASARDMACHNYVRIK
ncbi:uncharacterized protein LOC131002461 [Salvia miltiorrhiza]|uniref:uncharacterized protein LOC131002461 n=1 Tax=Salvia miltiorrhiza TaxID=226208 RepID=UPI0025AC9A47|nr:uncharacterized protein LOC131002461 [Salvia miltiorrhiza]